MEAVVRFFDWRRGLRARISITWRYTAHGLLISVRDVLRQTMCFGSQSPNFLFFWRSLSCVTVCQVMEMRARFAIGLTQQLPHLSNLLLCSLVTFQLHKSLPCYLISMLSRNAKLPFLTKLKTFWNSQIHLGFPNNLSCNEVRSDKY